MAKRRTSYMLLSLASGAAMLPACGGSDSNGSVSQQQSATGGTSNGDASIASGGHVFGSVPDFSGGTGGGLATTPRVWSRCRHRTAVGAVAHVQATRAALSHRKPAALAAAGHAVDTCAVSS